MKKVTLFGIAAVLACNGLAFGQVWNEQGDAGELLGDFQTPIGIGPLTAITGFRGPDADLYLIFIPNPADFEARTWPNSAGDTQLWLFDTNGFGITFNDDDVGLLSRITGQFLPGPGNYLLAISSFDYDARDAGNQEIWLDTPFGLERQPDGPGQANPLAQWGGGGGSGAYRIDLRGVEFIPAPGAMALLGLGGLLARRRRRR